MGNTDPYQHVNNRVTPTPNYMLSPHKILWVSPTHTRM